MADRQCVAGTTRRLTSSTGVGVGGAWLSSKCSTVDLGVDAAPTAAGGRYSSTVFNLIVGFTGDRADASRMLEYTDEAVREYVAPGGVPDPFRLVNLPTLVMPETGDERSPQVARLGRLLQLAPVGRSYRFQMITLHEFPPCVVEAAADELGIESFEFRRTHWAVKDRDLHGVLFEQLTRPPAPKVFTWPSASQDGDLVAVMMPFDARFDSVYAALREAASAAGLRCQRADDIWEADSVMTDIASLIWRSRIVVSDLTGKNPNVFYETGIAHTLGRDVVQITQSADDVPFDLRHLRYVPYLPNREGLEVLKERVADRLSALTRA
jgi:hypothetical protein